MSNSETWPAQGSWKILSIQLGTWQPQESKCSFNRPENLNLDDKALAYFWTLKDKILFEMFLFVELTQKMSISK